MITLNYEEKESNKEEIEELMYEVRKEDIENFRKMKRWLNQMFNILEIYLVNENSQNIQKIKQIREIEYYESIHLLQKEFFLENPHYLAKFNEIAREYDYFFKGDIQETANALTTSTQVKREIENRKNLYLINNIEQIEENEFRIETNFGDINFENARKKYKKETKRILEQAKLKFKEQYAISNIRYLCHLTAIEFIKMHKNHYLISSMCPHTFTSTWWFHSYVLTPDESTIIDFATNIIMERERFDNLFETDTLVKMKQTDLEYDLKRLNEERKMPCDEYDVIMTRALKERAKRLQKRK